MNRVLLFLMIIAYTYMCATCCFYVNGIAKKEYKLCIKCGKCLPFEVCKVNHKRDKGYFMYVGSVDILGINVDRKCKNAYTTSSHSSWTRKCPLIPIRNMFTYELRYVRSKDHGR